jgi:UDP-2,4-diacetamido-2,4,6-trideoxy-beta-L-altropyranose hydrolase
LKVAFRADASAAIGTGHAMRCRALQDALEARSATIVAPGEQTDWLVVDNYSLDEAWERQQRRRAARIAVIDDLADRRHDCDLLLDQNFFPNAARRYDGLVPARCRRLLGPRYALLRNEFSQQRKSVPERTGRVRRILVSFGGVDAGDETSRVIALLKGLDIAVDVVVGESNPHAGRVARECAEAGFACHRQASNMAELMAAADLAIGAGGSTTWERCCLGLPTLQVAIAPNQVALSQALALGGYVTYLGGSVTAAAIRDALASPEKLRAQAARMRSLVDGEGAKRVAAALFASPASALSLRPARAEDAQLYFDWANDPEVREQSLESRPVTWPEHTAWFARRLADSVLLLASDEAGMPAGQARFEPAPGAPADRRLSYSMAAEFRGAGLAATMLGMALQEFRRRQPGTRIVAEVKPGNAASRRVFAKLGFAQTSATSFELAA